MRNRTKLAMLSAVMMVGFGFSYAAPSAIARDEVVASEPKTDKPVIQIALLLDTSNSMDGLIDQARTQLWRIVSDFRNCHRDGEAPVLQVALYEYGNNGLPAQEQYVRQVIGFTDNLDLLSEKMFALKTNGGEEFCGQVIADSVEALNWMSSDRVYRAIFIAGNEPFTQGPLDYREAIAGALGKDIIVNTIHCGSYNDGVQGEWAKGAKLGKGEFLTINQDHKIVEVRSPYDDKIIELSEKLNTTYLSYGKDGANARMRQAAADEVAMENAASGMAITRSVSKANVQYVNAGWDLVDAQSQDGFDLSKIEDKDLPEQLRGKTLEQKQQIIDQMKQQRVELQKQINELNQQREAFVQKERVKNADAPDTLDSAMIQTIRKQASDRGFEFKP